MTSPKPIIILARQLSLTALALWAIVSRAGAAPPADFVLQNGLRIVVRERHETPLVAMDLWVRAGAREEAPGETGAAHFLEHTLFKGTTTRHAGEADMAIENLGATLSAATGPDYALYYTSVGAEHAGEALAVLADVVRNATLPAEEIERERQVIQTELAQRDSDPTAVLIDRLYQTIYRGHPYSRPPGGTAAAIRARTRDSLAAFYRRTYRPERCTLVLVGDLTAERAHEIAERAFGDWPSRNDEPSSTARPQDGGQKFDPDDSGANKSANSSNSQPVATGQQLTETAAAVRPMAGVAFRAPAAAVGPASCAAQIVAAMLGQSDIGGRLAVARLSGCQARVSFVPRRDTSLFIVSSAAPPALPGRLRNHDELDAAASAQKQILLAVLDGLFTAPPTAGELAAAKSALLGRTIFENETNAGLAASLGAAAITGGQTPEAWRAAIDRVTVQDVRQFIAQWVDPSRRVALVLLPGAGAGTLDSSP